MRSMQPKQNDKKVKSVYFIQFLLFQNTIYITWLRHSEIITDCTTTIHVCVMLSERKKTNLLHPSAQSVCGAGVLVPRVSDGGSVGPDPQVDSSSL